MDAIMGFASAHNLTVIEDACEALGATVDGRCTGAIGDCGVFGFYPNKQMTTGEGGMLTTNRDDIAALAVSMRNQGRDDGMQWLSHARLGYNYRISDINCALGIAQLERLDDMLAARARVACWYDQALADSVPDLVRPCAPAKGLTRSWFVYVVQLPFGYTGQQRNDLIMHLRSLGIGCNQYFPCIHLQPFYQAQFGFRPGDFPVTEGVSQRSIALPFHNRLAQHEVAQVVSELRDWLADHSPANGA
jgi:perosamine synthetase